MRWRTEARCLPNRANARRRARTLPDFRRRAATEICLPRVIWKGAITFCLVHTPVALYPASQEVGIDFDWLDKRSMDPVD